VGIFLYDADSVKKAAAASRATDVYPVHLDMLLDPSDGEIRKAAAAEGIAHNVLEAAARSPVYKLAKSWRLALPLHPEYRTLPMVWYIPPLSPIQAHADPDTEIDLIDRLRIPIRYLANMLTAGDEAPVRMALKRLAAIRSHLRAVRTEGKVDESYLGNVGLSIEQAEQIYRLLALAPYPERFVLSTAAREKPNIHMDQGRCGFAEST
jgi:nitrate reductase beta subunit